MRKLIVVSFIVATAVVIVRWRSSSADELGLSGGEHARISARVAEARQIRHHRLPLFGPAQTGKAMVEYSMAEKLTKLLLGGEYVDSFVYSTEQRPGAAEGSYAVESSLAPDIAGARRVAELLVAGADCGYVAWSGVEIYAHASLIRLAMAAGLHAFEAGEHRRAYRYVLAAARTAQDAGRVSVVTGLFHLIEFREATELLHYFVSSGELGADELDELARGWRRLAASQPTLRELLLGQVHGMDVFLLMPEAGEFSRREVADALEVADLDDAARMNHSHYELWSGLDLGSLSTEDIILIGEALTPGRNSVFAAVAELKAKCDHRAAQLDRAIASFKG